MNLLSAGGGMAEVFKVWDQERATYLALKLLREDMAEDPVFLRRFRREAQTLARLQHPNIVRFYGLEQDGLLAFILMEFVDGASLRSEIFQTQGQGLSLPRILEIMRPVCSALHYAHRQSLIHCDLKPGNVMIDKTGRILLADFGIARVADGSTSTMIGAGTPAYMAPELALGHEPSPQTDIYALGVMLFEMLTGGERPYTGEHANTKGSTFEKVRWEQLNQAVPSVRQLKPTLPLDLDAVLARCLDKNPEGRFATPLEFLNALVLATGGVPDSPKTLQLSPADLGIKEKTGPVDAAPVRAEAPLPPPAADQPPKKSRNRLLLGIGALVLLCVVCVVIPAVIFALNYFFNNYNIVW